MNTGFANEPLKVHLSHSEHTRFSEGEWSIESTPFVIQKLKGSTQTLNPHQLFFHKALFIVFVIHNSRVHDFNESEAVVFLDSVLNQQWLQQTQTPRIIALPYTQSIWVFPWESPAETSHVIKCHRGKNDHHDMMSHRSQQLMCYDDIPRTKSSVDKAI